MKAEESSGCDAFLSTPATRATVQMAVFNVFELYTYYVNLNFMDLRAKWG